MKFDLAQNFNRLIITIAMWLFIAAAVIGFDSYFLTFLQDKAVSLTSAKETTATLEAKRLLLMKERDRIKSLEPDITKIQNVFIDSANPLGFIEVLEQIAKDNSVTLKLGVPQKAEHTLVMQVEVEGSISGTLNFVKKIEALPQQVILNDITMEEIIEKQQTVAGSQTKVVAAVPRARIFGAIEFLAK